MAAANDSWSLLPIGIDCPCMVHSRGVGAEESVHRRVEPQRLLDRVRDQARVGPQGGHDAAGAPATGTASCRAGWSSSRARRPAADSRGDASRPARSPPGGGRQRACRARRRDRRRRPRESSTPASMQSSSLRLASTYVSTSAPLRAATASLLHRRKSSRRSASTPSSSAIASAGRGSARLETKSHRLRRRSRRSARR